MNERILELALAAFQPINDIASEGVADYHTFKQPWFQMYNEKFAELIIEECISTLENAENGYRDYRNQIEDSMRNYCIELIKHKFGVKDETLR